MSTGNGSAVAPSDYAASSGTLTIASGTTGSISIPIVGDTTVEADENFTVNLTSTDAGSITQATTVIITNDDVGAVRQLSVNDVSILEASSGTRTTQVRVSLRCGSRHRHHLHLAHSERHRYRPGRPLVHDP